MENINSWSMLTMLIYWETKKQRSSVTRY